ncbi:hypothetical protein FOL47_002908, partial [Perkinsus chesapeaki]
STNSTTEVSKDTNMANATNTGKGNINTRPAGDGKVSGGQSPPQSEGDLVRLGQVSVRITEKSGRRGIRFESESKKAKTLSIAFADDSSSYTVVIPPGGHRSFEIKPKHYNKDSILLTSDVGEQKTLPLLWKTLPIYSEQNTANGTSAFKTVSAPPNETPQRKSRRLLTAKRTPSPDFVP